jgi:hypothetical protein
MTDGFGIAGYVVLVAYLAATVLLGLSFARKQKSLAGYFLAERAAPWWAVGISILACDLSAISYMGAPSWTYYRDLRYAVSFLRVGRSRQDIDAMTLWGRSHAREQQHSQQLAHGDPVQEPETAR